MMILPKGITHSGTKDHRIHYPKGFDITLGQIFIVYDMNKEAIDKLRGITKKGSGFAYAMIGRQCFYRRSQLDTILSKREELNEILPEVKKILEEV